MSIPTIIRGEDKPIYLRLKKEDGNPYSFLDLVEAEAQLLNNQKPFKSYSKSAGTLKSVTQADQCLIPLVGDDSAKLAIGKVQLKFKFTIVDSQYPSGRREIETAVVFNVIDQ